MKPLLIGFGAGAALATVATAAVLMKTWRTKETPASQDVTVVAGDGTTAELTLLQKRIATLEADSRFARKGLADSERALVALRNENAEVRRQFEELKKKPVQVPPLQFVPSEAPTLEQVANLQKQAMDDTLEASVRVDALLQLRMRTRDGRTADVVQSVVALLDTCEDARIRADICRHLKGVDVSYSKEAMIRRLRDDKDAKVREEAAETLVTWKEDPRVRAELEAAARGDGEEKVREQATESLKGRK